MGQYYQIYIKNENVKMITEPNGGYKMIEFSHFGAPVISELCFQIEQAPSYVLTVGDYAEKKDCKNDKALELYQEYMSLSPIAKNPTFDAFKFEGKACVCYELGEYIDFDEYEEEDTYFPITILTALGNGKGSGDYGPTKTEKKLVGSWCGYHIQIIKKDSIDLSKFKNIGVQFFYE